MYCSLGVVNNIDLDEYYPLILIISKNVSKHTKGRITPEELIGSGWEGLVQAANKFDLSHKCIFKTLAEYRIRGAMFDYLRTTTWEKEKTRSKLKKEGKELVRMWDRTTMEGIYSKLPDPEYIENVEKDVSKLSSYFKVVLDPKHAKIMEEYYVERLTMKQIADNNNLTESRISQLVKELTKRVAGDRLKVYNSTSRGKK